MKKGIIIGMLALMVCLAGCSGGGYHYRQYKGTELVISEDIDFLNVLVINKRKGITAESERFKCIVGASNTQPDANSLEAIAEGAIKGIK